MCLPSRGEGFRVTLGKTGMVKDDFGSTALLNQIEFRDSIGAALSQC